MLVQGVGVAESVPNDDGSRSDTNQDFIAQGLGNLGSGLFQGQPVGGSVGQTAVNRTAGARTRCGADRLRALDGRDPRRLLRHRRGSGDADPRRPADRAPPSGRCGPEPSCTIWRTGRTSQLAIAITFVATLVLPVAAAVGIGVVVSLVLQLNQSALDLRVVELVPDERRPVRGAGRRRRGW